MWETLVAIFLAYSTSGVTSVKKVCSIVEMAAILKMPTYYAQVQLGYQIWKDHHKICKKSIFGGDDVIDDVTGWPQSNPCIPL